MRILLVLSGLVSVAWADNSLTRQERKEGFELLFDGKTLRRWHSIKTSPQAGGWHARKGVLTYDPGESWLATDDTYYDLVLRLEYRAGAGSDSGILLRASPKEAGLAFEIQGDSVGRPRLRAAGPLSGSSYPAKPDGEWNQVEITAIGRQVSAVLNGQTILNVTLEARGAAFGHIGLQAHAQGTPAEFRNIRVKVGRIGPGFAPQR